MPKYDLSRLTAYLRYQTEEEISLGMDSLQSIVGELPEAAREQRWWWNLSSGSRAQAWLSVGYKTQRLETLSQNGTITFVKMKIEDRKPAKTLGRGVFRFLFDEDYSLRKRMKAFGTLIGAIAVFFGTVIAVISLFETDRTGKESAQIYEKLADAYYSNGDYESALEQFLLASQSRTESDAYTRDVARLYHNIGACHAELSHYNEAIAAYLNEEAVVGRMKDKTHDDYNMMEYITMYIGIVDVYLQIPNYVNAMETAKSYLDKAAGMFTDGSYEMYQSCAERISEAYREDSSFSNFTLEINSFPFNAQGFLSYLKIQTKCAAYYRRVQNYREAYQQYISSLASYEYLQMEGEKNLADTIASLYDCAGVCAYEIGYTDEGISYCEKAVEAFTNLYGEKSKDTANALINLAHGFEAKGEIERAYKQSVSALNILKRLRLENDICALLNSNIAVYLSEMGQHEEALKYYQDSIELYQKLGIESMYTLKAYLSYALELWLIGDSEAAKEWADKAYALSRKVAKEGTFYYVYAGEFRDFIYAGIEPSSVFE